MKEESGNIESLSSVMHKEPQRGISYVSYGRKNKRSKRYRAKRSASPQKATLNAREQSGRCSQLGGAQSSRPTRRESRVSCIDARFLLATSSGRADGNRFVLMHEIANKQKTKRFVESEIQICVEKLVLASTRRLAMGPKHQIFPN